MRMGISRPRRLLRNLVSILPLRAEARLAVGPGTHRGVGDGDGVGVRVGVAVDVGVRLGVVVGDAVGTFGAGVGVSDGEKAILVRSVGREETLSRTEQARLAAKSKGRAQSRPFIASHSIF